jgi:hypothetical protein
VDTKREKRKDVTAALEAFDRAMVTAWHDFYRSTVVGKRRGVRVALAGACEFIHAMEPDCFRKYERIHGVLISALCDLDRGITVPLLQPVGRGRLDDSWGYREVQRQAAATVRGLMDIDIKREKAIAAVAERLRFCGFMRGTERAVGKWYDEILPAGLKQKGRPRANVKNLGTSLKEHKIDASVHYIGGVRREIFALRVKGFSETRIREKLLDTLSTVVMKWRPSPY